MHMDFPEQGLFGSETQRRYVAKPLPRLGVLVYFIPDFGAITFMGHLVPLATEHDDVFNAYLTNMADWVRDVTQPHTVFRANDVLTLKCLIFEAIENWSSAHD